tara:strand:- start:266 stop:550 length:285 start_codon:yes stop_codon:yes gene_type:complete
MAHNRLSNYRTTWTETNGRGSVVYVHTPIVEWNEDTITLKSGGWESVTTKRKMNQSALQFGLGFGVYQRNYAWFVDTPTGETLNFVDGMELQRV